MEIKTDKNIIAILRALREASGPFGGTRIAKQIQSYGIHLSPRAVRYYLALTDKAGFTRNLGEKRGRMITPEGRKELNSAFVMGKIGLVASMIDELSYRMKFSLAKLSGNIVLNISTIQSQDFARALEHIIPVFHKGLGMGQFAVVRESGSQLGNFDIPQGTVAIGTVCSVTINGIFLNSGIPVLSRFGGLLEMRCGQPVRFTEIIAYDGSTLDPLEIFIRGRMTSVAQAANQGNGLIGASFREIPAAAIPEAERIRKKLIKAGLGGILMIGKPGQALLDIPVPEGKAAMIVVGGLNPLAACEENNLKTSNMAMGTLFDFKELSPISHLEQLYDERCTRIAE
ncbi:MAG: NrpR regulatory domain-containing protein [bacterium]